MSPAAENVLERLDAARQRWWLFSLLTTTVLAACASFGVLLAFLLADALLRLSQPTLLSLAAVWTLATLAMMLGVARRLLRGQRTLEAAARRIEVAFPELGSNLINLVQFSDDARSAGGEFCDAAIRQAAAQTADIAFDRAAAQESRRRRFLYCMQTPRDLVESCGSLALLVGAALLCESLLPNWNSAVSRLLRPWEFVPSVGQVAIGSVTPGNTDVLLGSSVEITAEIANPDGLSYAAALLVTPQDDPESRYVMAADAERRHYRFTVPSVLKPFRYRLEIGDSQTEVYAVGIRRKPVVESVEAAFRYPAYLGRAKETLQPAGLDLEAPQYTEAQLRFHTSTPIAKGYVERGGTRYPGQVEEDGNVLVVAMPMLDNGDYTVRLFDDRGHTDPDPRVNRITVLADKPPTVELLKPARHSTSVPGGSVPVMIRADDDHGLDRVRLEMKVTASEADTDAKPTLVEQWTDLGPNAAVAVREHAFVLKPAVAAPGQTVLLRAVAFDKRVVTDWGLDLRPQETASPWCAVKIVAEEVQASSTLEKIEKLRAAVFKILERQLAARAAASLLSPGPQAGEGAMPDSAGPQAGEGQGVRAVSASDSPQPATEPSPHPNPLVKAEKGEGAVLDLRNQQVAIQKATTDLVQSIDDTDGKERLATKRILQALAFGDMLEAVAACDGLAKLTSADDFEKPLAALIVVQDRTIDVLRKLLDLSRHVQAETLAEMKKRPGGDLPDDAKQKLEDMRAKLDKFLKEQRKIIEASENLAKTPVDDFTVEQQEALKAMAAAEDDWSKFITDLHSDFSKLPEQDFANPSTAKELVEIQTELKMAADALTKKTADIAVPLEQLGYEMAEEIKTNIEKWLPDSPDREKWSQEESLTDKDKEPPMAELPGELEDMIGDLMEQEEDLFDEMEDVSSSAADSPDKGAGWDAVDGPISTYTAKGVTGNRLPNSSEIGGRSGEGRQGKSSGEFVGDEAVGKGGRKTPSRLAPDPFVKGQIKDHSKQSAGGATGGGKESGKGGEGLEGPQQRSPGQRDAERLAGRQAALRNKAESIDLQFQVTQFHHTDLKAIIEMMAQVERDLKAGRYQNALRQRQALAGRMNDVKQYLQGEFEVRRDTTPNLPAEVQKEILGSMRDPSPAGWEELNRRYFERLSGSEKKPE